MSKYYFFLFLLFSTVSFSQQTFSPGYYINQNRQRIEGFIEDNNPYNNPEKIMFKTSLENKAKTIPMNEITEYKIDTDYKYVKYLIEYDEDQVVNINPVNRIGKEPRLVKKQVLLRVLVEGNASLYQLIINDCVFFYMKQSLDETPQLLVHRKYNFSYKVAENNDFRKLLYEKLDTDKTDIQEFYNIEYNQDVLIDFFKKINNSDNSLKQQNVSEERNKNKLNYKILVGTTALSVDYKFGTLVDMKSTGVSLFNPMIGVEISNVLGISTKKSEIFGRIYFQKNQASAEQFLENPSYNRTYRFETDFSTVNLNFGYRHAIIKNSTGKLCIDGSLGFNYVINGDFILKDMIIYNGSNPPEPTSGQFAFDKKRPDIYFNFGLGYVFHEKYGLHIEYSTPKNYLSRYTDLDGQLSGLNLLLTYNIN